ncbi:MAG: hypothetical protein OXN92_11790 [Gammaproteobacteria bacterium]|nr:hypothetical protein [Gammaproteobacteria bacterium]
MSHELTTIEAAMGAVSVLASRLLGPGVDELGEISRDFARYWRLRNLMAIQEKVEKVLQAKGLDYGDLRHLSLSVGLPLLERASYQDDSVLQDKWANLMAASLISEESDGRFSLDVMHVEILNQMARLDCEVLEFVCERGIDHQDEQGHIVVSGLDPTEVEAAFSGKLAHISLEKLCALGAVQRSIRSPLQVARSISGLREILAPTLVGLNLYVASSGKTPRWMKEKGAGE